MAGKTLIKRTVQLLFLGQWEFQLKLIESRINLV